MVIFTPITFRIPSICGGDDTYKWRAEVLAAAKEAFEGANQPYPLTAPVAIEALVVLTGANDMRFRDVDNLLKQVLDALQGALADTPKSERTGVIANDHLVWKATVEKRECSGTPAMLGSVTIRPHPCE